MTRIRSKRQRSVAFEALEGRLALSAGMGTAVASHHADARGREPDPEIDPSFLQRPRADRQRVGADDHGPDRDNRHGPFHRLPARERWRGRYSQGGNVYLSNSKGTIQLGPRPRLCRQGRKALKAGSLGLVVVGATGKYAPYVGLTGLLTTWNIPAKPSGPRPFGGPLAPDARAYGEGLGD